MAVARVTQVIASSEESWDAAVDEAMRRASSTLRNITGIEVKRQQAKVEKGKIVEYRVTVDIIFILDD